jgi:hypothetical protein
MEWSQCVYSSAQNYILFRIPQDSGEVTDQPTTKPFSPKQVGVARDKITWGKETGIKQCRKRRGKTKDDKNKTNSTKEEKTIKR